MSMSVTGVTTAAQLPPRVNEFKRFRRVFLGRGVVVFGLVVILFFIVVAAFAPLIAPYDPYETDVVNALLHPSEAHLLGTDAVGRDVLSRVIYGSRTSLLIGLSVVAMSTVIGVILGILAGYYGGWVHTVIMRLIDAYMAFPMIILALVVASLLGGGVTNVIIALSVAMMPGYARLMCGQALSLRENDYIMAEHALGAKHFRIMFLHLIPNCFSPLLVMVTMMLGSVILAEAGLSFLGVGITPPTAAWGSLVNDGRPYLTTHPLLTFAPGIAIMLVVFAFNMVGDGLRDALDPSLRGTI
ncbi:MAG: ABC transporter permease [Dehalococcoidales bacterium]|nr:ABC transporter permease [Dehalococcoidales bacterium]